MMLLIACNPAICSQRKFQFVIYNLNFRLFLITLNQRGQRRLKRFISLTTQFQTHRVPRTFHHQMSRGTIPDDAHLR